MALRLAAGLGAALALVAVPGPARPAAMHPLAASGVRQVAAAALVSAPGGALPVRAARPRVRNWLSSADGSVHTAVGTYDDCTGRAELTRAAAAIDTCLGGRAYFVGHNPGVFAGLVAMRPGARLNWFDAAGRVHHLVITGVRTWQRLRGDPGAPAGVAAQFQTCLTLDGSLVEILDAAETA